MTILAFTGLVLSYGNALFSLLFLVWFIFALMDGRKVGKIRKKRLTNTILFLCKFVVNPKKTYGNDR